MTIISGQWQVKLFYISGLLRNFIFMSCYPFLAFTVMADQPQKVFNEGHISDQIVQASSNVVKEIVKLT